MSEHSNMSRTQDNFASNMNKQHRRSSGGMPDGGDNTGNDNDYQRIYGSAKGGTKEGRGGLQPDQFENMADLSDWERQSHRSGRSAMSQFSQINALKVKGLETIYLQRLEPASKGRKPKGPSGSATDKAKFRVMHHKFHDEPEWHVDDRDELDSIISGNYNEMQRKFE